MGAYDDYLSAVVHRFWDYAEREFGDRPEFFDRSERSPSRPPVFVVGAAEHNLLYPPGAEPSMRQAIVTGLPAVRSGVAVQMEYLVAHLGEPRSTSVDVWLDDGKQRVAVECKFAEPEFGRCSRPTLRPGRNANCERDHCDGTYTRQRGRRARCSLTESRVRYWQYLPELFDWPADRNMKPCPLDGTYQLARNVLAACVRPDGTVDANGGHALVIYDDRNPAFLPGGEAARQWEAATGALVRRPLLRRCSWQRLVAQIANEPDLAWLVDGLAAKYGIEPTEPNAVTENRPQP